MDIKQIKEARNEMENAIHEAIKTFHAKTSLCPRRIDIEILEITKLGYREKEYTINSVRAEILL